MNTQKFNIADHLSKLELAKGKNRYICPVCKGNNLTVSSDGAYRCWSGDCKTEDIRNAIAPLPEKEAEPAGQKIYAYADRQGQEIIRVVRKDDGNGSKRIFQEYYWRGSWRSNGIPDAEKKRLKRAVLPYRYGEAIKHDRIFWVEGEKCVDALWNLGIPATTTIGGCEGLKNYGDYAGLFEGKEIVVCPDQDQPGVKYAEGIAALCPSAKWLYAYPTDPRWRKPPQKGGLDVADWIATGATKLEIEAAIEPHARTADSKVTPIRPDLKTALTLEQTTAEIRDLLAQDLSPAALQAAKIDLRSKTIIQEREFSDLWKTLEAERELAESRDERKTELDDLLKVGRVELPLRGILHENIAERMETIASWLGATPAAMLLTLLPTIATLCQGGTELELIKETGFNALPLLYTGICAESGSAKSPIQKAILKPLFKLQAEAEQRHQNDLEAWEFACREAKQADEPPPPKPAIREYYTVDVTREAIAIIQSQQPDRGFLGWMDELSAVIGGQNQYRNGRGTDREALLSGRDGSGLKVNRASGKRISVPASLYSICGGTQPDTLRKLMGDFSDGSGQWARFLWCVMPVRSAPYPDEADSDTFDILQTLLYNTYSAIENLPARKYTLGAEARRIYRQWFNDLDRRRVEETRQALRSCYSKAKSNTGEIALLLHVLNASIAGLEPAPEVPAATMQAAIKIMKFCLGQVKLIHSMGDESRGETSPVLAKIIELADRKGSISARDARNGVFALRTNKSITTAAVRQMFNELVEMGHGVIEGVGDRARFTTRTVDPVDQTVDLGSTAENQAMIGVSAIEQSVTVDHCRSEDLHLQSYTEQEIQTKCRSVDPHSSFSAATSPRASLSAALATEFRSTDLQFESKDAETPSQSRFEGVDPEIYSSSTVESEPIAEMPIQRQSETVDLGSTVGSTVTDAPFNLGKPKGLQSGDRVRCVSGAFRSTYEGEILTIKSVRDCQASCVRPGGKGFTTWIPLEHLKRESDGNP